jgi:transmembrane sensor
VGLCGVSDKSNKQFERRAWRTDEEWSRLRQRIRASDVPASVSARGVWRMGWIAAAAAVLVVGAGVSGLVLRLQPRIPSTPAERVATTGVGERLTIRLGDSSVVTLGPMSTIHYSATGRSVVLDVGIADFNVLHRATRPFQVRAKNALVTDLGTEFVVRAYSADSGVDVSVTSGEVTVSGGAGDSVELRSGDVANVTRDGRVARVASASTRTLAAWVQGRLVFEDVPLGTVAAELNRWFDVKIRVPDRRLAGRRVSAVYNQPTLSGVLDAIAATLPVRYERADNVITILPATR